MTGIAFASGMAIPIRAAHPRSIGGNTILERQGGTQPKKVEDPESISTKSIGSCCLVFS